MHFNVFFSWDNFFFFLPDSQRIQCSKITKIQKQSPEEVSPLHGADLTGGAPWQERTSLSLSPREGHYFVSKSRKMLHPISLSQMPDTWNKQRVRETSPFSPLLQRTFKSRALGLPSTGLEKQNKTLHVSGQSLICRTQFSLQMGSNVEFWGPTLEGSRIWPQVLTIYSSMQP